MGRAPVLDRGEDDPPDPGTDPMDEATWAALCAAREDEQPPPEHGEERCA
jgi:hypothetical protein